MPNPSPRVYTCNEFGYRCLHERSPFAKKPAPAAQPEAAPFQDPKLFERYKFFSERSVFQPYILSLDVAEQFGICDEVEEMVPPGVKVFVDGFQEGQLSGCVGRGDNDPQDPKG
nr:hypothetical protein Itr_chr04CG15460 [Ipomoea trifida]